MHVSSTFKKIKMSLLQQSKNEGHRKQVERTTLVYLYHTHSGLFREHYYWICNKQCINTIFVQIGIVMYHQLGNGVGHAIYSNASLQFKMFMILPEQGISLNQVIASPPNNTKM